MMLLSSSCVCGSDLFVSGPNVENLCKYTNVSVAGVCSETTRTRHCPE